MIHFHLFVRSTLSLMAAALFSAGISGCTLWEQAGVSEGRSRLSGTGSIGGSGSAGFQRFTSDRPRTPGYESGRGRNRTSTTGSATESGAQSGSATESGAPQTNRVPTSRIPPLKPGSIGGSGSHGFSTR